MVIKLSWFLTQSGKKFSFGIATAASVAVFAAQYVPHTYLLNKYKDLVSMYQASERVPVFPQVNRIWNDTLADLNLPQTEIVSMEPFTVFGFDVFHAGFVSGRYGAVIGVPINYTFTDVSKIDPSPILVNQEKIDWDSREAKQLLEALILSEDAQKYGLAREILMSRKNIPLISALGASFVASSTYLLCRTINEKFRLYQRPLAVRLFSYFVNGLCGFFFWSMHVDLYNRYCETEADAHVAQLDERYTRGAIEFYDKMLKRNSALRTLLGAEGEKVFTTSGDEKFLFRQPRTSLETRKKFFQDNLANIKRNRESLDNDDELADETS